MTRTLNVAVIWPLSILKFSSAMMKRLTRSICDRRLFARSTASATIVCKVSGEDARRQSGRGQSPPKAMGAGHHRPSPVRSLARLSGNASTRPGGDIVTAGIDNDILFPAGDQVTISVKGTKITGMEPAIADCSRVLASSRQ